MLQFLQTNWYFWVIPLLLIVGIPIIARRRRTRREWEEMSQRKRRDEALNEALRNPHLERDNSGPERPMAISWEDRAVNEKKKRDNSPLVELVLLSEYSHRKYVYRLDQPIRIGSGVDNQMELHWEGVAPRHCEIFLNQEKPCVRSLMGAETCVIRGKAAAPVGSGGVYLNNGDHIRLGAGEVSFPLLKGWPPDG